MLCKYICLFTSLLVVISAHAKQDPTVETLDKIRQLNTEIEWYGGPISERILKCSYVQDSLISYLLKAENVEEYHRGMALFDPEIKGFRSMCDYISNYFNFYKGSSELSNPQTIEIEVNGQSVTGYLNTFKVDHSLTPEERETYFYQEYNHYLQDCIEVPFVLDASNIHTLEPDTLYNYALLPDGTIRIALERPGEREYHVRDEHVIEAFHYPNHTILAGAPDQVVMTAGALIIHQEGEKRLFFVSCKSGHFQPDFHSVNWMRARLGSLGINPYTAISVNDVDLSQSVLKTYTSTKVPLFICTHDCRRLFELAKGRWNEAYNSIDKQVLSRLASGDFSVIDLDLVNTLKKQRAESTYMRSAFRLFSAEHQAPSWFGDFVKHYGKLKDLIKHYSHRDLNYDRIQKQAALLLELMEIYDREAHYFELTAADSDSFFQFYNKTSENIFELLGRKSLTKEEFHDLKKMAREFCAFFLYLSEDSKLKGKGYFIYRTCADSFYQINDLMAKSDTIYAPSVDGEVHVKVPNKIANLLVRNLNHIAIAPPRFPLEFDSEEIKSLINSAKDVYLSSHFTSKYLRENASLDFTEFLWRLQVLLRDAEIARSALIFFDISHQSTELYDQLIAKTKQLIAACEEGDLEYIQNEAEAFYYLCYYAPSALQDYVETDQQSFNQTLEEHLLALHVKEKVQAFRDIMNLCRRDGILKKVNGHEKRLPTVCYDAMEEYADVILKGDIGTDEVKLAVDVILSRVVYK